MGKRVLVIDDDEAVRMSFTLALEGAGFDLDSADSGEEGLAKFRENPPDLVFLDLKMPGMNGVDTLREIRSINKKVPIYIVTAFHSEYLDQLNRAEEEGLTFELMRKPIGSDQILMTVRGILEGPVSY